MKPESLLALRQAVDERLSSEEIENILNSVENRENRKTTGKSGDGILKQISEEGIIDEIIEKLRGKPQPEDIPEHVTNYIENNKSKRNEIDPRNRYLSVYLATGSAFIEQVTPEQLHSGIYKLVWSRVTLCCLFRNIEQNNN